MDIQLKGSGKTAYSRQGDGRSPLGAVIREYLVSEAMHALGIPTTRSLAIVSTGETVQRQVEEPGGILTRVASSHIRIGTFNFLAARNDTESLEKLTEYTKTLVGINESLDLQSMFFEQQQIELRHLSLSGGARFLRKRMTHYIYVNIIYNGK